MQYPEFNPVAFHIGTWPVYWYGLMYLVGFVGGWAALSLRLKYQDNPKFTQDQLSDLVFYGALGAILGGRLGYMIFYDWRQLIAEPLLLFQTWKGGMSFHGGLLGVVVGLAICARKFDKKILELTDFICPIVPIGLFAGRIGNFINGELWGRVTDVPWGMVFPTGGPLPRHPSQLYEASLEGLVLFLFLWFYSRKPRPLGEISGWFALLYGVFRCFSELFRQPDPQLGFYPGGFTQGQLLSVPLIIFGIIAICWARKRGMKNETVS